MWGEVSEELGEVSAAVGGVVSIVVADYTVEGALDVADFDGEGVRFQFGLFVVRDFAEGVLGFDGRGSQFEGVADVDEGEGFADDSVGVGGVFGGGVGHISYAAVDHVEEAIEVGSRGVGGQLFD